MSYHTIKWILFTALFLTVPAMLFLVQAVMFFPAIFFAAGILYMIPKTIIHLGGHDTIPFMIIFLIHLAIYFVIFYLISVIAAKVISKIPSANVKNIIVGIILAGLLILTQFPVYGAGGHGPMKWVNLQEFMADINKMYGSFTALGVYGFTAAIIACVLFLRRHRKVSETKSSSVF